MIWSSFGNYYAQLNELVSCVDEVELESFADLLVEAGDNSNNVLVFGNGGSAAIASHLAIDLTKAASIPALSFHDPSLLTCFSNDFGFDQWIAKVIESFARTNDVCIFISSSGESPNMIFGAHEAVKCGCKVVTLSGFEKNNSLSKIGDLNFHVQSDVYNFVENTHQIWALSVLDYIVSNRG